jgi:uncharacterized protein with GYD domain
VSTLWAPAGVNSSPPGGENELAFDIRLPYGDELGGLPPTSRRPRPRRRRRQTMRVSRWPNFLFDASCTVQGVQGLQRVGGSSRRDAVATAVESVGGRLERFYFAFGDHDAFVIADLPNNQSVAAVALAVTAAGGASVRTVVAPDAGRSRRGRKALDRLCGCREYGHVRRPADTRVRDHRAGLVAAAGRPCQSVGSGAGGGCW